MGRSWCAGTGCSSGLAGNVARRPGGDVDHDEHTEPTDHAPAGGPPPDPLLAVRAELDGIGELPLEERAEVFERTHEVVVEELRALELG